MSDKRMDLTGALSGVAYVVLLIIAGSIGAYNGAPLISAPATEWGSWLAAHPPTTSDYAAGYLEVIALTLGIAFVAYLYTVLRRAEREGERTWLPAAALGAGLAGTAVKLASLPAAFAALYRARDGIDPQLATALFDMNNAAFALWWATSALMLAASAAVILRTGVLPRWTAYSGIATAALCAGSVPFFAVAEPPTFMLVPLWIAAVCVVLIRRGGAVLLETAPARQAA